MANSTISNPKYSVVKSPFGFPLDSTQWTIEVKYSLRGEQKVAAKGVWYNISGLSIDIPTGIWDVSYQVPLQVDDDTSSGGFSGYVTLSDSNNTETDPDFTTLFNMKFSNAEYTVTLRSAKTINLAGKTKYFLIEKTIASVSSVDKLQITGDLAPVILRAKSSFL